ncbi:MAG: hypothetical protein HUK02_02490 [Bacteroidaceae bacterium]|nr:hypothetical protein [Bacteroidaceae bacterium]
MVLTVCLSLCVACADDGDEGRLPVISWEMSSGRFTMVAGEVLTIVPTVTNTDATTTYSWTMEGRVVSRRDFYTFTSRTPGTYFIQLAVTNRFGQSQDEVKVTVLESASEAIVPEAPDDGRFSWYFPWTYINICQGRSLLLRPYMVRNAEGAAVPVPEVEFCATELGPHAVTLTMLVGDTEYKQTLTVNVCPPEGTFRRSGEGDALVNRVFDYQPAPGIMVNGYSLLGESFPVGCTLEQACATVMAHFRRQWAVSLGAQGGYLIAGFDHSVAGDLLIKGNPFNYQSEPGIVWVSLDANGDGLPNDQWFELAGSEYGSPNHQTDYAITYYRPEQEKSGVAWRDSNGDESYVPHFNYWNPSVYYWQDWQTSATLTFVGSRLVSHHQYADGFSTLPPYAWGYPDNEGSDTQNSVTRLHLSNARTWDGKPANLPYIDFVKVQTGQCGFTPNLGEISTEVYSIEAAP